MRPDMRPEFMLVEIAYHGATLPAVTHALELMENLSPPPVSNAVWINAAAVHVMASMDALENVRPLVTSVRTTHIYNRAFDDVNQAFTAVDETAARLGIEIRLNQESSTGEKCNTHLIIECRKVTAMMERAMETQDTGEKQALLLAIRETDHSIRDQVDEYRQTKGLPPLHALTGTDGTEVEQVQVLMDSVPPHAADTVLQAHQAARDATTMRRKAMPVLTVDNPTIHINPEDHAPSRIIEQFQNQHDEVAMAVILPITPEYLAHNLREEIVLLVYEHGANILCHTGIDPYPRTVTNSIVRLHAERMLHWADECGHEGESLSHPKAIRDTALHLLTLLETRTDPTGWD